MDRAAPHGGALVRRRRTVWAILAWTLAVWAAVAALVLVAADTYLQSARADSGIPDRDEAVQKCALNGLRERARRNRLALDQQEGHGKVYDELLEACRRDPTRFKPPEEPGR